MDLRREAYADHRYLYSDKESVRQAWHTDHDFCTLASQNVELKSKNRGMSVMIASDDFANTYSKRTYDRFFM